MLSGDSVKMNLAIYADKDILTRPLNSYINKTSIEER